MDAPIRILIGSVLQNKNRSLLEIVALNDSSLYDVPRETLKRTGSNKMVKD
jgi:hypothetical protein